MTPMKLGVNPSDIATLQRAFAVMPTIADREFTAFMERTTLHLQAESQERAPTAFGTLRASIISAVEPLPNGYGVTGLVGSSLSYAQPVELGTKPHWAPLQPLIDWVEKKGLGSGRLYSIKTRKRMGGKVKIAEQDAEIEQIAKRIQYSIAHRGTLGVGMFHRTWAAQKREVHEDFAGMVQALASQLPEAKR